MAFNLLTHTSIESSAGGAVTTSNIDTTGAKLLIACPTNYYPSGTLGTGTPLTDSKSNTWQKGIIKLDPSSEVETAIFYCLMPSSVGTGHNFSFSKGSSYSSLCIAAFSADNTVYFDQENGASNSTSTTHQTGSVTPTTTNQLIIAFCAVAQANLYYPNAVDSSFSLLENPHSSGGAYAGGLAYLIETSIVAKNPQFTLALTARAALVIATFKDVTPPSDTTKPSDVTNLTATKVSNSQVDLDSDAATDNVAVAGYQTQVSTDGGSTWNTLSATTKAVSFVSGNTYFPTTPGTYSLTFRRKAFDTASPTPNYSNDWSNIPTAVSITVPVTPPVASFNLSSSIVVVGGTITLTDTSTNTPTSRQWKLDEENLATTTPYALNTTGLEIGTHTIDLNVSNSGGSDDAEQQTFEVIESFLAEYFEKLEICKLFNITDIDLALPLLEADFGDGYGAGVLSGKASGLQRWTISADPILDLTDYNIDFIVDGEPQTDTPLNYFWEFFRRHIALGNKPFYFVEPRTGRKFLASFVEPRLSLKVFTKAVYGTGVQIKQRRFTLEGLEFRESDGSVNE